MLNSLIPLATVLSSGASWFTDAAADAPLRTANTLITPQEPSTLVLALIGIATVALYLVATGLRLPRQNVAATTDVTSVKPVPSRYIKAPEERASRGAA